MKAFQIVNQKPWVECKVDSLGNIWAVLEIISEGIQKSVYVPYNRYVELKKSKVL